MRRSLVFLIVALLCGGGWLWWRLWWGQVPSVPSLLAVHVPAGCRQMLLVLSPATESKTARLWMLERPWPGSGWRVKDGPFAATLGHKGLGWGKGAHSGDPPPGFPEKREGDKRSPAGVFRIPFAFGIPQPSQASHLRLPYIHLSPSIIGVDDPKSRYYNQVVDSEEVERDWDSNEAMNRHTVLYEWGAFIAHNPGNVPGLGSCIFLHLQPGEGKATAGCTALSASDLQKVIRWLDADWRPHLVQGLEEWP